MITAKSSGSFKNTEAFLRKMSKLDILPILEKYGEQGAIALSRATPANTGLASQSWGYRVYRKRSSCIIEWTNSDNENGFPVVIMLRYGYGTGTGGYVRGRNFISPAIEPVMNQIATEVWRAVTSA